MNEIALDLGLVEDQQGWLEQGMDLLVERFENLLDNHARFDEMYPDSVNTP